MVAGTYVARYTAIKRIRFRRVVKHKIHTESTLADCFVH